LIDALILRDVAGHLLAQFQESEELSDLPVLSHQQQGRLYISNTSPAELRKLLNLIGALIGPLATFKVITG
jgi:hypothetical protein